MQKITRRFFLFGALGTALAGAFSGIKLLWGRPEEIVVAVLHRRVGYLKLDPSSFASFASDYVEAKSEHRDKLRQMSVVALPYRFVTLYGVMRPGHPLRRLEDSIVSYYLQSTDFFQNGADEKKPVRYVAFFDLSKTPCRNFVAGRSLG